MGCDSRVYISDYGTEAGREGYGGEEVKEWKTERKMGTIGTATFAAAAAAAAASLRILFTTRHSCHHKNVVMDKTFEYTLDPTPSLSTLVRRPKVGKWVGAKQWQTPFCLLMIPSIVQDFIVPPRR